MIGRWKMFTLLFTCAAIGTWWVKPPCDGRKAPLNCRAQTKLFLGSGDHSPIFRGTFALRFNRDGTGIIGLTGMLSVDKHHYRVLRTAFMQSKTIDANDGWFNVRRNSEARLEYDNAPSEVIDNYLLGKVNPKAPRVFHVWRLNDQAYLIVNMHSPIMVCSQVNV